MENQTGTNPIKEGALQQAPKFNPITMPDFSVYASPEERIEALAQYAADAKAGKFGQGNLMLWEREVTIYDEQGKPQNRTIYELKRILPTQYAHEIDLEIMMDNGINYTAGKRITSIFDEEAARKWWEEVEYLDVGLEGTAQEEAQALFDKLKVDAYSPIVLSDLLDAFKEFDMRINPGDSFLYSMDRQFVVNGEIEEFTYATLLPNGSFALYKDITISSDNEVSDYEVEYDDGKPHYSVETGLWKGAIDELGGEIRSLTEEEILFLEEGKQGQT